MVGEVTLKEERCKDCPLAKFSISTLYSDDKPIFHAVICEHERACCRMEYIHAIEKESQ